MNGYFQLVHEPNATLARIFQPTDGGQPVSVNEIADYLRWKKIYFDINALNKALLAVQGDGEDILVNNEFTRMERECYLDTLSPDKLTYTMRFYPPSVGGERMTQREIFQDLFHKGIRYGIQDNAVNAFVEHPVYCTDIVVAKGTPVVQGKEGYVEYLFDTKPNARPTLREDGSVDFFHLNLVNHCSVGDKLAVLHPSSQGTEGKTVRGEVIKPLHIKVIKLRFGKNIELSEDQTEIYSKVDGHVELDGDIVYVSDVLEVENVDPATGNIDYEGSVVINGSVTAGYTVQAKGNIEVKGVVEGATLEAGGNITIARGMNGMGRGVLKAGQNIVVKYLENVTAQAEGNVTSESILHSNVSAGNAIEVTGKKGFITGGKVTAASSIKVRTLGSDMGATTVVEVGVDPTLKRRCFELENQKKEIEKVLKTVSPALVAMLTKMKQGVKMSPDQVAQVQKLSQLEKVKKEELANVESELQEISQKVQEDAPAEIVVQGAVYPGTQITISGASMNVQNSIKYCKFVKVRGDVKVNGL